MHRHLARVREACRQWLPARCALCAAPSPGGLLCDPCIGDMPVIAHPCPRCGLASPDAALCGRCLAHPPPYASTLAAWRYAFPADQLLQALKYGAHLALAEPLADALARAVVARGAMPDLIVAMPLSRERQRARGFNHAHEIARHLTSRVAVPLVSALSRIRHAPPQAGLSMRERASNVRGAFAASKIVEGRSVAIVDDVMTTGATLAAATQALLAVGALRADCWVVARTPPADKG